MLTEEQPKVSINRHQPLTRVHKGMRTCAVFAVEVRPCHSSGWAVLFPKQRYCKASGTGEACMDVALFFSQRKSCPGACRQGQGCSHGQVDGDCWTVTLHLTPLAPQTP